MTIFMVTKLPFCHYVVICVSVIRFADSDNVKIQGFSSFSEFPDCLKYVFLKQILVWFSFKVTCFQTLKCLGNEVLM